MFPQSFSDSELFYMRCVTVELVTVIGELTI